MLLVMGSPNKALRSRALELAKELKFDQGRVDALNLLGHYYDNQGDYRQARGYFKTALDLALSFSYRHGNCDSLNGLATVYHNQSNYLPPL